MEVVKNAAKAAVTRVEIVTPATEATYDLIGLSKSQMAIICILTGRASGSGGGLFNLYDKVHDALGQPGMDRIPAEDLVRDGRLILTTEIVSRLKITD